MRELFPGQEENERIYLVIREHWFTLFINMIIWFAFVIVLTAINYFLPLYISATTIAPYQNFITLFKDIFIMFMCLGIFMTWSLYFLNIKIITDQRIVEISYTSIFSHTISELSITKIEDVTSEVTGIFGNMFSFGNVYVQTAGKEERFAFNNVPSPDKLERLILNLYDQKIKEVPNGVARQIEP
jgi:ABC-type multidrug transport system fused ATPase/permease subunit